MTAVRALSGIGAVMAGFVATAALSVGMDAVMHVTGVFPPFGQAMSSALFVVALAYRTAFTVAGGWITARLAPDRPMRHVLALAVIGVVAGSLGVVGWFFGGPEMGPLWYPVAIVVLAPPSLWAGATIRGA